MDILAQEEIIRRIATIERKIDEINRPEVVLVGDIAAGVYGLEDDAGVEAEPAVDGNIQLYSSDDTVSIVSGVDDINFTIDVAPGDAQYLTLALDADLDNERVFVAGAGCTGVDGGAGGNYTLNVDDPHVEIHVVNSTGPHAEGGLTIGHVLRASAAAAFSFAELQHDDLGGVGTGDHHSQVHNVTNMGDHTVVGAQWDVLGCDGLNVLGMLTPSDDPGAAIAILRTDAAGLLNLVALDVDTISDESGGDLTLQPAGDIVLDPTGNDVTLVEANLTIPTTYHLYLRDVALTIYSSADGQLDIDADTELELTSPTIQLVAVTKVDVDGDLEVDGDLDFVGAQEITTTAGDLTIAPAGDVIFDPAGDDILPTTNYDLNIGALSKKYLTIHAAELWVETLVAQDTIATIGGRVLVGPTTMLAVDLAAGTVNGANDILNPGFEIAGAGDPDFFANWIENGGDGIIAQDAVIFHSGAKSAKLTNGETSSTYVSQEIVVVPADDKELVFWARGDGTDEGRYRVYDVTNGADIQAITATGVGLATWTRVAYRYEVPALCIAVRIDLYCPERIATPVLNPGFEDAGLGGVDVFDEWTESAGDGAIAQDGVIFSGGAESAKLTSGPTFNTSVYQDIAVIPGDNRELIFMARGDGANQGRYRIYDITNDANIVAIAPTGVAAAAWNKVQDPYTVPAGCVLVRLSFYGPAVNGADTWFDDVDDYRAGDAYFDDIDHYDQVEISVEHNEMVEGDISYMEANAKVEFFDITSDHAGVGPYTYYVRRDQDGSGANDWYAGDAMFNTGAAGDGFIDLYSIQSIGAGGAGPTIVGNVRNSDTYNDWTEYWAIGNLDGMYGYGVDIYGVGLGEYGGEYVTIEATNGIRMYSDGNQRVAIDTDGSFWFGDTAATERLTWDTVEGLRIFNADNEAVITVDTAGDAYIDNRLMINMGDAGIFADNGLLLLGPGCELTSTSWTSLRGQEATIANAFQTRAGAFPGTRGIVMEPGTTNYCFNGAMYDDDDDDEADLWTLVDNCTDPVSIDVQAHPNPIMGWLQRFYYTGLSLIHISEPTRPY